MLERARAGIEKHKVMNNMMTSIGADLAIAAAQGGRRDEAIDDLRALFALHMNGGVRLLVGCAGEALVRLLIERGSTDDFAEAHRIVDEWQSQTTRHSRRRSVVAEVARIVGQGRK